MSKMYQRDICLSRLACHTHAGLLERLALVLEMHAGLRTARLSEAALHRLTRTLLTLVRVLPSTFVMH